MNLADAIRASFENLQLIVRWIFPGVLAWLSIPFVTTSASLADYTNSGSESSFFALPAMVHIAFIFASGFTLYLIERLVLYEGLVMWVGYRKLGIGAAQKFKRGNQNTPYHRANGRFIWVRFGLRQGNRQQLLPSILEKGKRYITIEQEQHYFDYMASRVAWIHALGSVWLVAIIARISALGFADSAMNAWTPVWNVTYFAAVLLLGWGWYWQGMIAASADWSHYDDIGDGS